MAMGKTARRKRETWLQFLWAVADVAGLVAAFSLAYAVRFHSPLAGLVPVTLGVPPFRYYLVAAVLTGLLSIPIFRALGLYSMRGAGYGTGIWGLLRGVTLSLVIAAAIAFFYRRVTFSRVVLPIAWALAVPSVALLRRAAAATVRGRMRRDPARAAVIGGGEMAEILARHVRDRGALGYELVGAVRAPGADPPPGLPVLGTLEEVDRIAREHEIDLYLVALPLESQHRLFDCLVLCEQVDVDFEFVPDLLQLMTRRARVTDLDGLPLISLKEFPLTGWNAVAKRAVDLTLAVIALPFLLPVFAAMAIAIKLDSPGPAFYRQTRMGRDGRAFEMLKFRSMRADAERESGPVWTAEADPRRTRLGTWLRATSLDELPQIWNVLKGEMSLVGPRPERPYFVEQFTGRVPNYFDRHRVKSGMTGWAQVNGLRGNTPIEERTRYDLFYIENWSLLFDLRILLLTFRALAGGRQKGAY